MSIGSNIKRIREAQGMSQTELAKAVGVTQSMLCQVERGTKALSLPLGADIAGVLNCNIEDLLKDS